MLILLLLLLITAIFSSFLNHLPCTSPMSNGNLILTQPNEYVSHKVLAEFTPQGDLVCYHDPDLEKFCMDIKFYKGKAYVLDNENGLFVINETAGVVRKYGKKDWPTKGERHFGFDFDSEGNVFVIDEGPQGKMNVRILKFNKDEEYEGEFIKYPYGLSDIYVDDDYIWCTEGMSAGIPHLVQFSKKDGSIVNKYLDDKNIWWLGSSVRGHPDGDHIFSAGDGLKDSSFDSVIVVSKKDQSFQENWFLEPKAQGGNPVGLTFDDKGQLFVMYADPFQSTNTTVQHVQVYKIDKETFKGTFLYQFGGHKPSRLLSQPFNGIEFINFY